MWRQSRGFTLIEILMVIPVMAIVVAIAVPSVDQGMRLYAVNNATQSVASAIRAARLIALSKNRTVRLRFNCPSPNAFRIVEVVGSAIDGAANRCEDASYPYPDQNAAAAPDVDGPVLRLAGRSAFGTAQDIEFDSTGRLTRLNGCPSCVAASGSARVAITDGATVRTVTVTGNGQISIQ